MFFIKTTDIITVCIAEDFICIQYDLKHLIIKYITKQAPQLKQSILPASVLAASRLGTFMKNVLFFHPYISNVSRLNW